MTALETARYIIRFAHEHGDPVSNLKLQKLLYYAQAWHLAINDEPLFQERLEAWVHGPVVPPVYGTFKKWTWQTIPLEVTVPELSKGQREHLDEVMDVYGSLTALYLEKLTHQEDPWRKARAGLPPDASSNATISHEDMRTYYKARLSVESQDQAG
jgi:uncharacterized phage-associated protein